MNATRIRVSALILISFFTHHAKGDSPLADAVEKSDASRVRTLLSKHVDVTTQQADGMTALHWAVYRDDLETAKLLIAAKADVKAANRYGVTPLSLACTNGDENMVTLLLDSGADPDTTLRGGETVLFTAARTGKLDAVKALLARGADVNGKERRGQTPLMWAAAEGHAAVVEALINAGADLKASLPSGYTPLFFAVREGRAEVVRDLLKAGADVNAVMDVRKSAGKGPNKGTSPLVLAVENGHFELAVALLEAGADPNDQRSGFTALHTLTWVRKPNRGDDESGDPAPIGSGNMSSLELVDQLVKHGADVNIKLRRGTSGKGLLARKGATPFLIASQTDDVPLMKSLLRHGADPKRTNVDGATPLMAAAGLGTLAPGEEAGTEDEALEAVAVLLKLGLDVNAVDANGETATHGAAYKSLPRVVQLLADNGAKVEIWNRKDKYNWTPLSIAEGHRPGNFKPSPETIAALHKVMLAAGVKPPPSSEPVDDRKGYQADEAKKPGR